MTLTEFLTKHASSRFRKIADLAKLAKDEGLLKKSQPQKDFVPLLEQWMRDNSEAFYAEVYFSGHGRLKARLKLVGMERNIGLFKIRHVSNMPSTAITDKRKKNYYDFHRLWTACVGTPEYNKKAWQEVERELRQADLI